MLAVVGVTAGIPVAQSIDSREYAKRLREKVEKNNAQLTKETASGAQQDLIRTINKLSETLSPEELAAFLQELKSADIETVCNSGTPAKISPAPADSDATSSCSASEAQTPLAEKWRGWGGGV